MFFFHDECDLVDDDQYDLFTLTTHIERQSRAFSLHRRPRDRQVSVGRYKPLIRPDGRGADV